MNLDRALWERMMDRLLVTKQLRWQSVDLMMQAFAVLLEVPKDELALAIYEVSSKHCQAEPIDPAPEEDQHAD